MNNSGYSNPRLLVQCHSQRLNKAHCRGNFNLRVTVSGVMCQWILFQMSCHIKLELPLEFSFIGLDSDVGREGLVLKGHSFHYIPSQSCSLDLRTQDSVQASQVYPHQLFFVQLSKKSWYADEEWRLPNITPGTIHYSRNIPQHVLTSFCDCTWPNTWWVVVSCLFHFGIKKI